MKNTLNHEYEAPALYQLGEAKQLTRGTMLEADKLDPNGLWRIYWGGLSEDEE